MSCPRRSEYVSCTDTATDNIEEVSESNKSESDKSGPESDSEPCSEKSSQQSENERNLRHITTTNTHVTDVQKNRPSLVKLCWRLLYDMMLLCIILSTVLGVVHNNNKQVIRGSPKPRPFFPGLRVRDYYRGDVFQAFRDAGEFENSLLMFYAPWDRESMQARSVLHELANFFHQTDIMIAAVNCWYPTSDCAKEFGSKTSSTQFPVFIFYPAYLKGIQYRGVLRSDHLISWVQRCRYPVTSVQSLDHFQALITTHPSILVGYTPHTTTTTLDTNHIPLLTAANHLLESYPDSAVSVAVTADPAIARSLHLHHNHPVRLFTWNSTHIYPNKTLDSNKLHIWAIRHHTAPTSWLNLPGRKSLVLQRMMGKNTLLVLTNNNMLYTNSVAAVVREVSTRYKDCNNTQQAQEQASMLRARQGKECEVVKETCVTQGPTFCQLKSFSSDTNGGPACRPAILHNISDSCSLGQGYGVGHQGVDEDVQLLLEEVRAESRNRNKFDNINSWVDHVDTDVSDSQDVISGLSCADNRSLSIYTVDIGPGGHGSLADALGVEVLEDPKIVIVSPEDETVVEFETNSKTFRHDLEQVLVSWHGEVMGGEPGLRSSDRGHGVLHGTDSDCDGLGGHVSCVTEVTRDTFHEEVLASSSTSVLFYTSNFCSHCTVVSHVFHAVARLMVDIPGIQFRMMDASKNDLPWQFSALAYPTVLVFPQHRKDSSRVFPTYKELNTTNLLAFIVSNLTPEVRLKLALKSCDSVCLAKVRLSASNTLANLERLARRRSIMGRRGKSLQQQLKYTKTVLYVVTAWAASPGQDHPEVSQRYSSAIIDSFVESKGR